MRRGKYWYWGVCSWPWQSFARGKPTPSPFFLWTVTDVFQLKYTGLKCSRVLCVRDKQLFSVVFYVVTAVHKFDFRLVMYETPNEWRPVERRSCSDRKLCFWQDLYVFRRPSSRVLRDSTHAVQVNCVLFTQWMENFARKLFRWGTPYVFSVINEMYLRFKSNTAVII